MYFAGQTQTIHRAVRHQQGIFATQADNFSRNNLPPSGGVDVHQLTKPDIQTGRVKHHALNRVQTPEAPT
ncbi:hypothetical protein D3C84_949680 [compost metagenome]